MAGFFSEVKDNSLLAFYATTGRWVEANAQVVRDFRAALKAATEFIAANREKAKESESTYLRLSLEIVQGVPLPTYALEVKRADVRYWVDVCTELGLIRGPLDASRVVAK